MLKVSRQQLLQAHHGGMPQTSLGIQAHALCANATKRLGHSLFATPAQRRVCAQTGRHRTGQLAGQVRCLLHGSFELQVGAAQTICQLRRRHLRRLT